MLITVTNLGSTAGHSVRTSGRGVAGISGTKSDGCGSVSGSESESITAMEFAPSTSNLFGAQLLNATDKPKATNK